MVFLVRLVMPVLMLKPLASKRNKLLSFRMLTIMTRLLRLFLLIPILMLIKLRRVPMHVHVCILMFMLNLILVLVRGGMLVLILLRMRKARKQEKLWRDECVAIPGFSRLPNMV